MRVHVCAVQMTLHRADVLEAYLNGQDNIQKATVYERTGDVVLTYRGSRKDAAALLAKIYPVGSLYLSTVNVSPASFLGGEWVPWGTGRTPVGVDAAQTEFASPEQVGGAKSVVLTGENLPTDAVYDGTVTLFASGNYAGGWDFALRGEGKPVPVLQPYITCYMFKRTA